MLRRRDPCALPEEHLQLPGPHLEDDRERDVRGRGPLCFRLRSGNPGRLARSFRLAV
jgi:hypothetical protein